MKRKAVCVCINWNQCRPRNYPRFNPSVLESVHALAPELWFAALGVSMPPALTLPLTCNAASRKPRADCGSHGARAFAPCVLLDGTAPLALRCSLSDPSSCFTCTVADRLCLAVLRTRAASVRMTIVPVSGSPSASL